MVADEYSYRCEYVTTRGMVEVSARPESFFLVKVEKADKLMNGGKR